MQTFNNTMQQKIYVWQEPIPKFSALSVFAAAKNSGLQAQFWQTPEDEVRLGLGKVAEWFGLDFAQVQAVKDKLQTSLEEVNVIDRQSLALFGAFAFDSQHKGESIWQELAQGYFILPEIILTEQLLSILVLAETKAQAQAKYQQLKQQVQAFLAANQDWHVQSALSENATFNYLSKDAWTHLAQQTIQMLKSSQVLNKVVLARKMAFHATELVPGQLMANLVALQKNTYRFYLDGPTRHFFGATPERLLKATASKYLTASVAGTIRRGQTTEEDVQLANLLLNDAKNTKEHQIVVEAIQGKLAPFVNGKVALGPRQILKNEQVQHIFLTLTGQRQEQSRFLEVIENLHPTPALGGNPKEAALSYLQANENLDRGLYGAPIGYYRLFEDSGEFVVGIRSGVYGQEEAIYGECFAGCGIVQDSNAEEEFEETKLKFEPMKRGLLGLE